MQSIQFYHEGFQPVVPRLFFIIPLRISAQVTISMTFSNLREFLMKKLHYNFTASLPWLMQTISTQPRSFQLLNPADFIPFIYLCLMNSTLEPKSHSIVKLLNFWQIIQDF